MTPTPQQLSAIHAPEQHVVCLAPAGSGKTFVLTSRAMYLIDSGIDPSEVLCLTFTRRAAHEMLTRMRERMTGREDDLDRMWIGTVHSIALRILELYGAKLGYQDTGISVVSPEDSEILLTECALDSGLAKRKQKGGKTHLVWRSQLSAKQAREYLEAEYGRKDKSAWTIKQRHELDKLVNRFHNRCREMHALTFGLILRECDRLLSEHPDVLAELQQRFRHVLVDECQDSSSVEFSLYEKLSSGCCTFLAGDLRQAIFSFKDARPDMLPVWVSNQLATIYDLENCFRCGDRIVAAANQLIAHNPGDPSKPMVGMTGKQGQVLYYGGDLNELPGMIHHLKDRFYSYGEIAIIGRRHRTLGRVQSLLSESDIPYLRTATKDRRHNSPQFRLMGACMRLVVNPHDELAAALVREEIGMNRAEWAEVKSYATRTGDGIGMAMFAADPTSDLLRSILDARAQRTAARDFGLQCVSLLAKRHGSDIQAAYNAWMELEPEQNASIGQTLRAFGTRDLDRGEDVRRTDAVTLITAHAAKGLEWPVVIVACVNDGEFPSRPAIKANNIAEERRLFYVAATRAREQLIIHYETEAAQECDREVFPPSRFIDEMECAQPAEVGSDAA